MSSGSSNTVTFQPSGVTNIFPVFNDFSTLSTYITSQPGINNWTILVDGSQTSGSPSFQSGSFSLPPSVSFEALPDSSVPSGYPTLSGDSVSFSGASYVSFANFPFIQINNVSGPAVFIATTGQNLNVELINCTILAGFNPFFSATNGGIINITMHEYAVIGSAPGPSAAVLSVDSTSGAYISAFDASQLIAGAVSLSTGGTLGIFPVDSATIDPSYSTIAGVTVTSLTIAQNILYTPSVPGNWNPVPTQVAQALDELAANNDSVQITALQKQINTLKATSNDDRAQIIALNAHLVVLQRQVYVLQDNQKKIMRTLCL